MMDQGPVLVLSFTAQQIMVVRDSNWKVVEGDPVSDTVRVRLKVTSCCCLSFLFCPIVQHTSAMFNFCVTKVLKSSCGLNKGGMF